MIWRGSRPSAACRRETQSQEKESQAGKPAPHGGRGFEVSNVGQAFQPAIDYPELRPFNKADLLAMYLNESRPRPIYPRDPRNPRLICFDRGLRGWARIKEPENALGPAQKKAPEAITCKAYSESSASPPLSGTLVLSVRHGITLASDTRLILAIKRATHA